MSGKVLILRLFLADSSGCRVGLSSLFHCVVMTIRQASHYHIDTKRRLRVEDQAKHKPMDSISNVKRLSLRRG